MSAKDTINQWSEKIAPSPVWFMIEVGLLITTGALASIFSHELGDLTHYTNIKGGGAPVWELWGFWVLFFVTVIVAGMRHSGMFRLNRRLTQEMILTVRTQPQSTVLARYNDFFKEGFSRYRRLLDVNVETLEPLERTDFCRELEQVLRDILADVCKLAKLFNPHHSSSNYAANIMLYVPLDGTTSEVRGRLVGELRFMAANQGLDGLCGVLRLIPHLSCDNEVDPNRPKQSLRPLCLPIPLEHCIPNRSGRGHHWFVLPGGPRAYVSSRPSQVPDVRNLGEWCRENTAFDPERIGRIEAYMAEASDSNRFGSFYSLPLLSSDWRDSQDVDGAERADDRPMGVINIESVHPGIFEMPDPSKDFYTFIGPILLIVSELVELLVSLEPDYATRENPSETTELPQ